MRLQPYVRVPIHKIFPSIGCIFCPCCFACCRKGAKEDIEEMKEAMREELKEENETLDHVLRKYGVEYTGKGPTEDGKHVPVAVVDPEDDDPLAGLGFGFDAYWKMLSFMSVTFLVLTLLALPQLIFFYETKGLEGLRNYNNAQFTLGNLGFSKATCTSQYESITNPRYIGCSVGQIDKLYSYGLIPDEVYMPDWQDDHGYSQCGTHDQ